MTQLKRTITQFAIAIALIATLVSSARAQDPREITPFKPFRIADNLYFVGTEGLGMFLVTTPKGHVLINGGYELNVRRLRQSVEYLGFRFSDIRVLLASHAHGDHVGGLPMVKRITGASYMVMDGDVPVVESGGAADFAYGSDLTMRFPPAKVDRVLHDGDTVSLGDTRLVAHLMPGHTKGATTWTMQVNDRGTTRNVMILSSPNVNEEYRLVNNAAYPQIAGDFRRAFDSARTLRCDIFLAAHGSQFQLRPKYERLVAGDSAAFVDPDGCRKWLADRERVFEAELAKQQAATPVQHGRQIDTAAVLASARADIEAANAAWLPGLRSHNADVIVAAYADSGLFIGPDGVVTRGRSAVRELYASRFPRMREIRDGGVVQDGMVVVTPDLIYEWGHAWLEMAAVTPGGAPVRSGGAYLTVWKREGDGHWHITRNIAL